MEWRELLLAELSKLDVRDALIFADDPSATALACTLGLPALLELGVTNVLPLGDAPFVDDPFLLAEGEPDHADPVLHILARGLLSDSRFALRVRPVPLALHHRVHLLRSRTCRVCGRTKRNGRCCRPERPRANACQRLRGMRCATTSTEQFKALMRRVAVRCALAMCMCYMTSVTVVGAIELVGP